MAFVGLKYVVAAPITETPASGSTPASVSYADGFVVGKAITANINVTVGNVKLYGDDTVAEVDNSFSEGTMEFGVTKMTNDIQTKLLGHTEGTSTAAGEITAKSSDVPPYNGIGFYAPKLDDHVRKYRAIWLTKTVASEPSENFTTRQGQTAFGTPTISVTLMEDITGAWKTEKTFDTEAAAIAWLNGKAGIA